MTIKPIRDYFRAQTEANYFGDKAGAGCLLWVKDGEHIWKPNMGCYNTMSQFSGEKVYASLWCRYENLYEAACYYWDYLLSPDRSPFKGCLKGVVRLYDENNRPCAFGLTDMDAHPTIVMSLLLQSRVPQEQASKLRSFWYWHNQGFEDFEALLLSEYIKMTVDGNICLIGDDYHHAFEVVHKGINAKRLRDSNPYFHNNRSKLTIKANAFDYRPLDLAWGEGRKTFNFSEMLKGSPKYTGHFDKLFKKIMDKSLTFKNIGIISKEDAVIVLKDKRSEWSA